jgi:hypothetical protein
MCDIKSMMWLWIMVAVKNEVERVSREEENKELRSQRRRQ